MLIFTQRITMTGVITAGNICESALLVRFDERAEVQWLPCELEPDHEGEHQVTLRGQPETSTVLVHWPR